MPLPDYVTSMMRRSIQELLSDEVGLGESVLQDVVRAMLQRAFERGVNVGIAVSAKVSGEGIEMLKAGLTNELGIVVPPPAPRAKPMTRRRRSARIARIGGRQRAANGAVAQAIDLVLAENPAGLRIIEIRDLVVQRDRSISPASVTNELRRYREKRYHQDGKRWLRIGDVEKRMGSDHSFVDERDLLAGRSGLPAAAA